VAMFITGNSS